MEMKMSAPAATIFSSARVEDKNTTRSRLIRQGSFVLAVAAALAVAACSGGGGLDTPMGPVDHGCHTGQGGNLGGEGSGCS
jgi:hypothetical protein